MQDLALLGERKRFLSPLRSERSASRANVIHSSVCFAATSACLRGGVGGELGEITTYRVIEMSREEGRAELNTA